MVIDLEPVAGTDAFRPIVTDLRRRIQPMVRVKLDDLLRPTTCACGSAHRAVEPVLGRDVDVWRTARGAVTPEAVDDHFARALPLHARWRVRGRSDHVAIELVDAAHASAMRQASETLLPGATTDISVVRDLEGPKRRRVTWEEGER